MTDALRPQSRPRPTIAVLGLVTSVLMALGGCAGRRDAAASPPPETLETAPAAAGWTALGKEAALIRLPNAGYAAQSLFERRTGDGLIQEVVLPAGRLLGRNRIVLAIGPAAKTAGPGPGRPTEAGIRAELAAAFPDRAMRVVTRPRANAFGAYGLAVASGPGSQRCVYAWQWLDGDDRPVAERLGGSASWRARICRGDATLDQIAADLDRIDLGPGAGALRLEPSAAGAAPSARRSPTAAARSVASRTERPKAALEPIPTGSTSAPGGLRYLAPVAAVAGGGPAAPGPPATLDASLPAEAYRGPATRSQPQIRLAARDGAAPRAAVPAPD